MTAAPDNASQPVSIDPVVRRAALEREAARFLSLGDHERATLSLITALELAPGDAAARERLGRLYAARGDLVNAREHLRAALALSPDRLTALIGLSGILAGTGHIEEAESLTRRALDIDPLNLPARARLGLLRHAVGDLDEAEPLLRQAIAANPADAESNNALGTIAAARDSLDEAQAMFEAASRAAPRWARPLMHLGALLRRRGDTDGALTVLQQAMALAPQDMDIQIQLGSTHALRGEDELATTILTAVAAARPGVPEISEMLGSLLLRRDDATGAVQQLAPLLEPGTLSDSGLFCLGQAAKVVKDYRLAEQAFATLVGRDASQADAEAELSVLFYARRAYRESLDAALSALAKKPDLLRALNGAALALSALREHSRALEFLDRALALAPGDPWSLMQAARTAESAHDLPRTVRHCEAMLAIQPDHGEALALLVHAKLSVCDWAGYDGFTARLVERTGAQVEGDGPVTVDVFNLQALPAPYALIAGAARLRSQGIAARMERERNGLAFAHIRHSRSRLRIGYLLPSTWFHSLPHVLRGIIEKHDRSRFEVFGFSIQACDGTPFSQAFRASFDRFTDVSYSFPWEAARDIHAASIDILVDVTGHTPHSCLPVMACRPAPVQVHYLGYSITTGASFIDHLITDDAFLPPDLAALGTERAVYLPDSFLATTRAAIAEHPATRTEAGLPADALVLANFNHPCKLTPDAFAIWMRLLHAHPRAILWLCDWLPAATANLKAEAARHGIDPARLVFAPTVEHAEHCARLRFADLAVDCLTHGGGITSVDLLWCGVPLLTMAGDTPSSRLGATLSRALGATDLVVDSIAAYEGTAHALLEDPQRLASLRRRMAAARDDSALFDGPRYVRRLEAAFETIWAHRNDPSSTPLRVSAT